MGTQILGSSIGTYDYTQQHLYPKYVEHTERLSNISSDAQHVHPLLQACVNIQPIYLLRILPSSHPERFTLEFVGDKNRDHGKFYKFDSDGLSIELEKI